MRSWMKEVVIEKKPCSLGCGDCSHLKSLLENICGMETSYSKDHQQKNSGNDTEKVQSKKRSSTSKDSGPSKVKQQRRSSKERKSRSRSRKSRHCSKQKIKVDRSRERSSDSDIWLSYRARVRHGRKPEIHKSIDLEDPLPNFLSIFRLLITLEQHISKYSNDIRRLFSLSLSYERQKTGSSNELLTMNNINILVQLKHHLKDQIVEGHLPANVRRRTYFRQRF
jgi:hypothetical protein